MMLSETEQDVLNILSIELHKHGYQNIQQKRISYQAHDSHEANACCEFQGLTLVKGCIHSGCDSSQQMIKWFYYAAANSELHHDSKTSLNNNAEIEINKQLLSQLSLQVESLDCANDGSSPYLALPVEIYERLEINEPIEYQPLAFMALPFYSLGNVRQCLLSMQAQLTKNDFIALQYGMIKAMADAVDGFHRLGWVHGDIKPSNILVSRCELIKKGQEVQWIIEVKLTDFALASPQSATNTTKFDKNDKQSVLPILTCTPCTPCTQGTPVYLAPECWQGKSSSAYSDYYALGVSMLEILIGKRLSSIINKVAGLKVETVEGWRQLHCHIGVLTIFADIHVDKAFCLSNTETKTYHQPSKQQLINAQLSKLLAKNPSDRVLLPF